jgi:hypothetical protein
MTFERLSRSGWYLRTNQSYQKLFPVHYIRVFLIGSRTRKHV